MGISPTTLPISLYLYLCLLIHWTVLYCIAKLFLEDQQKACHYSKHPVYQYYFCPQFLSFYWNLILILPLLFHHQSCFNYNSIYDYLNTHCYSWYRFRYFLSDKSFYIDHLNRIWITHHQLLGQVYCLQYYKFHLVNNNLNPF